MATGGGTIPKTTATAAVTSAPTITTQAGGPSPPRPPPMPPTPALPGLHAPFPGPMSIGGPVPVVPPLLPGQPVQVGQLVPPSNQTIDTDASLMATAQIFEKLRTVCFSMQQGQNSQDPDVQRALQDLANAADAGTDRCVDKATLQSQRGWYSTMTRVPDGGTENRLPSVKEYRLLTHTGDDFCKKNREATFEWLETCMTLKRTYHLTDEATKHLMAKHATGQAKQFINESIASRQPLAHLVGQFERVFSDLVPPQEARRRCGSLVRGKHMTISEYAHELYFFAKMATRDEVDARARAAELAREYLLIGLDELSRQFVRSMDAEQAAKGLKPHAYNELIALLTEREKELELQRSKGRRMNEYHTSYGSGALKVSVSTPETKSDSSGQESAESESSSDGSESDDHYIRRYESRSRDRRRDKYEGRRRERAPSRSNRDRNRSQPPKSSRDSKSDRRERRKDPPKDRNWDQRTDNDDEQVTSSTTLLVNQPDKMGFIAYKINTVDYQRPNFIEFKDLNVAKDECAKCGLKGHFMGSSQKSACPLREKPLETTPCSLCKKGGHKPSDCVRNFQRISGN